MKEYLIRFCFTAVREVLKRRSLPRRFINYENDDYGYDDESCDGGDDWACGTWTFPCIWDMARLIWWVGGAIPCPILKCMAWMES
jgi:hypothetical protein